MSFEDAEHEDAEDESSSDDEKDGWEEESSDMEAVRGLRQRETPEVGRVATDQSRKEQRRRRGSSRFLPVQLQFLMRASSLQDSMLETNNPMLDERKDDKYVLPFCKRSLLFMRQFEYVYLHPKNPLLARFDGSASSNRLRHVLQQRREVHKLFDLIKCSFSHLGLFPSSGSKPTSDPATKFLRSNLNLLLKDTYLTFEQLLDLDACESTIQQMKQILLSHIMSECTICEYQGERCQFGDPSCLFKDRRHKQ